MEKWFKLELNSSKELDIETWINKDYSLMLQNHCIKGWEIVPNTNDSKIINNFYKNFPNGISGKDKQECIEKYER